MAGMLSSGAAGGNGSGRGEGRKPFDLRGLRLVHFSGFIYLRRDAVTVNRLLVPLADFPAGGISIHETVAEAEFGPGGELDVLPGAVTLIGRVEEAGGAYTFTGTVSGGFHGPCDRCPKRVDSPFAMRVAWTFLASDPDADDDEWESGGEVLEDGTVASTLAYANEELDLGRAVRDEVMLAVPSKFPPLDEERRRCTACGEDIEALPGLDRAPATTFENSGLAALKDMFPNLPKGPEQE